MSTPKKHDFSNAEAWLNTHRQDLETRLKDFDDEIPIRKLLRIQLNFLNKVEPLLEAGREWARLATDI